MTDLFIQIDLSPFRSKNQPDVLDPELLEDAVNPAMRLSSVIRKGHQAPTAVRQ